MRLMLTRVLEPTELSRAGWLTATVCAVAVGVGGYFHGHLFHEGYSHVQVVGPLFFLNALGSGVVIALLVVRRALLFLLGALVLSVGSLVSILISHSTSFFGFAENAFDSRAQVIVIAEIIATLFALALAGFVQMGRSDQRFAA